MPDILDEMEFRSRLQEFKKDPEQLAEFMAWQTYNQSKDCKEINKHLKELNGTVSTLKTNQQEIQKNQCNVLYRVWKEIPILIKAPIVLYFLASIGLDILIYKDVI